jgi:hypothetical protein
MLQKGKAMERRGEERREGGATLSCVPMTEIGMPSEGYFAV